MNIIYNNVLYAGSEELHDGLQLKEGLFVPYSHPGLCIEPTDDQIDELPAPLPEYGRDTPPVSGLYLALFHGSGGLDREAGRKHYQDWGFNGPIIGPLSYVHTTYTHHVKVKFVRPKDLLMFERFATGVIVDMCADLYLGEGASNDCLIFNGDLYGDWTVYHHKVTRKIGADVLPVLKTKYFSTVP